MHMCFVPLNGEGKWRSVLSIRLAGLQRLLAHVGHEENDREDDAECTDDDVADGEEVVAATEHVSGREHKPLLPIEGFDVVEVLDLYNVLALGEPGADLTEELAEVGEPGGTHPDNEVFYTSSRMLQLYLPSVMFLHWTSSQVPLVPSASVTSF